jgi:hypothetical protein
VEYAVVTTEPSKLAGQSTGAAAYAALLREIQATNHLTKLEFYVREIAKVTISFVRYICPSAWKNTAPSDRAFMKFHI